MRGRQDVSSQFRKKTCHFPPLDRTGPRDKGSRSRNVRSRCRCSLSPAIRISYRGWPRSSSTDEPSDPPSRVLFCFVVFFKKWFLVLRFWQVCEEQRETTGGVWVRRGDSGNSGGGDSNTYHFPFSLIPYSSSSSLRKKSSIGGGSGGSAVISRVFFVLVTLRRRRQQVRWWSFRRFTYGNLVTTFTSSKRSGSVVFSRRRTPRRHRQRTKEETSSPDPPGSLAASSARSEDLTGPFDW